MTSLRNLATVKRLRRVYGHVELPNEANQGKRVSRSVPDQDSERREQEEDHNFSIHKEIDKMAALGDDLLSTVNKLQDLVFNTIGNDSLDLPQIVCSHL